MGPFKSDFLRSLSERGLIHQITDAAGLDARAQSGVISAYIGFDATADSLHIGNLVQIMLLRRMQQAGHRPIVLMGGGTTKVGDPSGRIFQQVETAQTEAEVRQKLADKGFYVFAIRTHLDFLSQLTRSRGERVIRQGDFLIFKIGRAHV